MQAQGERVARYLLNAQAVIFGLALFDFLWVSRRFHEYHFHRDIFIATLLLVAALCLLLNQSWSNLVAAILSGYLPLVLLNEFWMFPHYAEVPILSYRHLIYPFQMFEHESGVLFFFAITLLILVRAVFAILRFIRRSLPSHDA